MAEGPPAVRVYIRLLTGVCSVMHFKVGLSPERLPTVEASVRFLTGVNAIVHGQVRFITE